MNTKKFPMAWLHHHSQRPACYAALALSLLVAGCGGGGGGEEAACSATPAQLEASMTAGLGRADSEVDFSFAVQRKDGRVYTYNRGASTLQTFYESASTSKIVSSVIILRLVEQGYLHLTDRPQDYISSWPIGSGNTLYPMTLENLLSFTSGLTQEPPCLNDPNAGFESCVDTIASTNAANGLVPGSQFFYAPTHQQVAGLMAVRARGVASWQEVFAEFKAQTGVFPTTTFDVPSTSNPRIAGGMHFTGSEYMGFLRALRDGRLLTAASMNLLLADHTASIPIAYSPFMSGIGGGPGLGEDWHFGLGLAQECRSAVWNCTAGTRISSPGALGSYPFWDRTKHYIGIVVRQGVFGTLIKGINIERSIQPTLDEWASC